MRIGIDARPLAGQLSGIGRYVLELCHTLDAAFPDAEFFAYSPYSPSVALPSQRWIERQHEWQLTHLGGYFWLKYLAPSLIAHDRLDWFVGTRTLLPSLPENLRSISVAYDLNHVIVPRTMTPANRLAHTLFLRHDVRRATRVVAISAGTASRLARYTGRRADLVVHPGIAPHFGVQHPNEIDRVRAKHGLNGPYLLSVATFEPRKNIGALIDAFLALKAAGRLRDHTLVLAGAGGWGQSGLARQLEQGIPGIRRLGFVDDADLPPLYAGADAFVFPSIYEGYGMPVAEALACGTRVVATNIPELREAAHGRAVLVDPDAASIASGIEQSLLQQRPDPLPRDYNAESKRAFAALFTAD
ncbi:glycosyltransferase family 1 protein [Thermomonas sp.]|uniref:glycosyltransferase family 4 protein n=1 Tax=Thermomonas sp. TaxID=1971895 RepID=UPI0024882EFA|nr:glycosyltransferase family 1 protein [Thermomonas sp.]MDI1254298.1 glycosyltransferase family 1 protein [Thermomonas sp.]